MPFLLSEICAGVSACFLHPHAWVRLLAAQLLGLYLAKLPNKHLRYGPALVG